MTTSNSAPLWKRRRSSRYTDTAPRVAKPLGLPLRDLLTELALLRFGGDFEQARLFVDGQDRAHPKCGHAVCSCPEAAAFFRSAAEQRARRAAESSPKRCILCQRAGCTCSKVQPAIDAHRGLSIDVEGCACEACVQFRQLRAEAHRTLAPGWSPHRDVPRSAMIQHVCGAVVGPTKYAGREGQWFYSNRALFIGERHAPTRDEAMALALGWSRVAGEPDAWGCGETLRARKDIYGTWAAFRAIGQVSAQPSLPHAVAYCRGDGERVSRLGDMVQPDPAHQPTSARRP